MSVDCAIEQKRERKLTKMTRQRVTLSGDETPDLLVRRHYDWPGNVRELQNVIQRAAIFAQAGELRFDYWSDFKFLFRRIYSKSVTNFTKR
jgi:transcriptional regulator with PAS, ATPase and Fis domain